MPMRCSQRLARIPQEIEERRVETKSKEGNELKEMQKLMKMQQKQMALMAQQASGLPAAA